MQINIHDSRMKNSRVEGYCLDETDFHPCKPFFLNHPSINPESADNVNIRGLLEHTHFIRYVLKMAEAMLKVGGKLGIDYYMFSLDSAANPFRSQGALMYEISLCFKERLRLVNRKNNADVLTLIFEKIAPCLPIDDRIDAWSFGIVSDGRKNERILQIIGQIEQFSIPYFEVLICGPTPADILPNFVKVLDDSDLYFDSRVPISKKKNRLIENASYNNLVLLHDRFSFPPEWYENVVKHGNFFDGFSIRILDEDTLKHRIQDWISTSLDHYEFERLFHKRVLLSYDEWVPNWNINGGFMIIKKHLLSRVMLNSFLHWGEAEDGDLCRRLDADGFCLSLYTGAYITTQTHRFNVGRVRRWPLNLLQTFKGKCYSHWYYFKRKRIFMDYLKGRPND